ncbi:MAG TPA: undecaprenyl-diphosphate phosphatase [Deinococcales bacterium]|nr:undecaprenyl-diphosphate phosphatase [Deinococcales bacterium]
MTPILQAIILGIVEGITEFLPISSTGHLIVAESLVGYKDVAETFTVVIQVGAILAVVWYYRHDLVKRIAGLFSDPVQQRFWLNLVIASVPAGLVGLIFQKTINNVLAANAVVAISLIAGGLILWWVESIQANVRSASSESEAVARIDGITPTQALYIGLGQILALVPGVSRSGASIVSAMLAGLDRATATAFSFYLGLPILILASAYKLFKERHVLGTLPGGTPALAVGTLVSGITAFIAVAWLLGYITKHNFKGFAVYRVIAGLVIIALIAAKVVPS